MKLKIIKIKYGWIVEDLDKVLNRTRSVLCFRFKEDAETDKRLREKFNKLTKKWRLK